MAAALNPAVSIENMDVGRIEELMNWRMETLREVFALPASADLSRLEAANRAYYLRELPSGGHVACLVKLDGQAVGCGGVCFQREMPSPDNPGGLCAYLMNIYTRPAYQHRGLGRAVVEWLVARARERGAGKIYLETSQAGRRLYEALGFTDMPDMMQLVGHRFT